MVRIEFFRRTVEIVPVELRIAAGEPEVQTVPTKVDAIHLIDAVNVRIGRVVYLVTHDLFMRIIVHTILGVGVEERQAIGGRQFRHERLYALIVQVYTEELSGLRNDIVGPTIGFVDLDHFEFAVDPFRCHCWRVSILYNEVGDGQ